MNKNYFFPLFLLTPSPWPLFMSISLMVTFMSLILFIYNEIYYNLIMSFFMNFLVIYMWWKDVIMESFCLGYHNKFIINFTVFSMIMFIISEVFFFISFFWTFFHSMASPDVMLGMNWPPQGIYVVNYMDIPLLNSMLLLSSSAFVTWSHNSLIISSYKETKNSLIMTIFLGISFLLIQIMEYYTVMFSFSDSIYGSIFFMATGFHGIHVLIGSLFLMVMLFRMIFNHFSKNHMMGFEFSIWYWHFVDLVWLYLFVLIYWFSS